MKFENMKDLIGKTLYVLHVAEVSSNTSPSYVYGIIPDEMTIQEIRLGEARREVDKDYYGPGFVTWLCQTTRSFAPGTRKPVRAFSPVGDEIIANSSIAGRNTRAFFDKNELYKEAQILKECVLKNYKHVEGVEICLPKPKEELDERIQDACVRSKEGFSSGGVDEKEICL